MKRYHGVRAPAGHVGGVLVEVMESGPSYYADHVYLLEPAPGASTFQWGYQGAGPTSLAAAMLRDCFGDEPTIEATHLFRDTHLATMEWDEWFMAEVVLYQWRQRHREVPVTLTDMALRALLVDAGRVDQVRACAGCRDHIGFMPDRGWVHPDGDAIVRTCRACGYRGRPHALEGDPCPCGGALVDHHCAVPMPAPNERTDAP